MNQKQKDIYNNTLTKFKLKALKLKKFLNKFMGWYVFFPFHFGLLLRLNLAFTTFICVTISFLITNYKKFKLSKLTIFRLSLLIAGIITIILHCSISFIEKKKLIKEGKIKHVPIGAGYDVIYDKTKQILYYANGSEDSLDIVNTKSLNLIKRIKIPKRPYKIIKDEEGNICITLWKALSNQIWIIDEDTFKIKSKLSCPRSFAAHSIAIDSQRNRIYVGFEYENFIAVFNKKNGKIIGRYIVPGRDVSALMVNPLTGDLYGAEAVHGAYLFKINGITKKLNRAKRIGISLDGIIDNSSKKIYLSRLFLSRIDVFNADSLKLLKSYPAEFGARGIKINTKNNRLYAANYVAGSITVNDLKSGKVLKRYPIFAPRNVSIDEINKRIYVAARDGLWIINENL